jgi:hypothetical protein
MFSLSSQHIRTLTEDLHWSALFLHLTPIKELWVIMNRRLKVQLCRGPDPLFTELKMVLKQYW